MGGKLRRTSSESPLDLPRGGEPVEPQSNSEFVESVEPLCARLKRRGLHWIKGLGRVGPTDIFS